MRKHRFLSKSIRKNYSRKIGWHGGAPPSCPVGSACCGGYGFRGECEGEFEGLGMCRGEGRCGGRGRGRYGFGYGYGYNWLGSVTEIPICKVVSFTHNAI